MLGTLDSFFINLGSYSQDNFNMLEVLPSTLIKKVQKVFDHRANMNGASTEAKWDEKLEQNFAA